MGKTIRVLTKQAIDVWQDVSVWLLKKKSNRLNFMKTQQIFSNAAQMLWENLKTRKGKANLNWKGLFHLMNMQEDQRAMKNYKWTSITEKSVLTFQNISSNYQFFAMETTLTPGYPVKAWRIIE